MVLQQLIKSRQNSLIRRVARLHKAEWRQRERLFIIEGAREVRRALQNGFDVEMLLLIQGTQMDSSFSAIPVLIPVTNEVFAKISLRENPDGILAVATLPQNDLPNELAADSLLLLVERMEKPGNLGAIIRTAECTACALIIVADPLTDLWNANVIRASQGAIFSIPIAICNNEEALQFLRKQKLSIVATSPSAKNCYWDNLPPRNLAIAIGNENRGLSDFWLQCSDVAVHIPLWGTTSDSLNAATAAALCLYEARRRL